MTPHPTTVDPQRLVAWVREKWAGIPIAEIAVDFILNLARQKRPPTVLTLGDVQKIIGEEKSLSEILSAMTILTTSSRAIFEFRARFHDDGGRYIDLDSAQTNQVWREDVLIHPRTGEPIKNAQSRVVPCFMLIATFV